jgi:hydroxyacyl-ACP dehydratase HTD2-like protein with hotdog domain
MLTRLRHCASLIHRPSRASVHANAGEAALDSWVGQKKGITLSETLHTDRVADLYITLPTRDGTTRPYARPKNSEALGFGHHLAFFHPRTPERYLRPDGTESDFCPPEPFVRRMWAGGRIEWRQPLIIGGKACARASVDSVSSKGLDGPAPMVFVKQRIEIANEGEEECAVLEERTHVYLALGTYRRMTREGEAPVRQVMVSKAYADCVSYVTATLYSFTFGVFQCVVCRHRTFRSSSRPVQQRSSDSPR